MEGKFEAELPGDWNPNKGIYEIKVTYAGEGPFNGQYTIKECPPVCNGDFSFFDNRIKSHIDLANIGLKNIPKEKYFSNLNDLVDSATSDGIPYKEISFMMNLIEKQRNQRSNQ